MSPSQNSINTMRIMRDNNSVFTVELKDGKIAKSYPGNVRANAIRALRKHGYVFKREDSADKNILRFYLSPKALSCLEELDWQKHDPKY